MKKRFSRWIGILLSVLMITTMIPVLPAAAKTVAGSQKESVKDSEVMPFKDVKGDNEEVYSAVAYAFKNGLMNGVSEDEFDLKGNLTRAMFVTVLGRSAEIDESVYSGVGPTFTDEEAGKWYTQYVEWAYAKEITYGIGHQKFGTNDFVTREQIATFIERYLKSEGITLPDAEDAAKSFKDEGKVSDWASEGVDSMRKAGIFKGGSDGNFRPKDGATREDAVLIFTRLDQAIEDVTVDKETDTDGDGIPDYYEKKLGTDINSADSDGDSIDDYIEVKIFGYDPMKKDSDGNGITDDKEDYDCDGILNIDELNGKTDPILKDTDHDQLDDNDEITRYNTDPVNEDTDGDGASDGDEVRLGTDPLVAETSFTETEESMEISEYNPVSLKVEASVSGDQVGTLEIEPVLYSDNHLISPCIPGYLGYAYDISVEDQPESATLTFKYDESLGVVGDSFEPRVYYLNEEDGTLEELPDQIVENGSVKVNVSHFSTYILVNRSIFKEVISNPKSVISDIYNNIKDTNDDGIPDAINELIKSGDVVLSNGSREFIGKDFNYDKNGNKSDDYDLDGVKNGDEIEVKYDAKTKRCYLRMISDPTMEHSDADGISDYEEHKNGSDPMVNSYPVECLDIPMNSELCFDSLYKSADSFFKKNSRQIWSTVTFNWSHVDESKNFLAALFKKNQSLEQIQENAKRKELDLTDDVAQSIIAEFLNATSKANDTVSFSRDAIEAYIDTIKNTMDSCHAAKDAKGFQKLKTFMKTYCDNFEKVKMPLDEFEKSTEKLIDGVDWGLMAVGVIIKEANDLDSVIETASALSATQEAFVNNREVLEYIRDNSKERDVSKAAEDILSVLEKEHGSFYAGAVKDFAWMQFETAGQAGPAITMILIDNPYIAAVSLFIAGLDLFLPLTDIAESEYSMYAVMDVINACKSQCKYSKSGSYCDVRSEYYNKANFLILSEIEACEISRKIANNQRFGLLNHKENKEIVLEYIKSKKETLIDLLNKLRTEFVKAVYIWTSDTGDIPKGAVLPKDDRLYKYGDDFVCDKTYNNTSEISGTNNGMSGKWKFSGWSVSGVEDGKVNGNIEVSGQWTFSPYLSEIDFALKTGENVLGYYVDDYDADGMKEAFAVTGDSPDEYGISGNVKLYFVDSLGNNTVLEKDVIGFIPDNPVIDVDKEGHKVFAFEHSVGTIGSAWDYVYGVQNGKASELDDISGKYFDLRNITGGDYLVIGSYLYLDDSGINKLYNVYFEYKNGKLIPVKFVPADEFIEE